MSLVTEKLNKNLGNAANMHFFGGGNSIIHANLPRKFLVFEIFS